MNSTTPSSTHSKRKQFIRSKSDDELDYFLIEFIQIKPNDPPEFAVIDMKMILSYDQLDTNLIIIKHRNIKYKAKIITSGN